jgi:hypothetical protein
MLDKKNPIITITYSEGDIPIASDLDSSPILVIQYRADSSRGLAF